MVFYSSSNGSADNPITIKPYPGERILSDGVSVPHQFGIKIMDDVSNIHIEGPLIISNREYSIVTSSGVHSNIKISNFEIRNCQHGPRLYNVSGCEISSGTVHNISTNGFQIYGAENVLVRSVTSYYVSDGKAPGSSDADGFYVNSRYGIGNSSITFLNCVTYGNSEDGFDLTGDVRLENCISNGNNAAGVKIWRRIEDNNYTPRTLLVINSAIYNNGYYAPNPLDGNPGIKISQGAGANIINCVVYNNYDQGIIVRNNSPIISYMPVNVYNCIIASTTSGIGLQNQVSLSSASFSADYNLFWQNKGADCSGFTPGGHSLFENPLFVSPETGNLSTETQSPARGNGIYLSSVNIGIVLPVYLQNDIGLAVALPNSSPPNNSPQSPRGLRIRQH